MQHQQPLRLLLNTTALTRSAKAGPLALLPLVPLLRHLSWLLPAQRHTAGEGLGAARPAVGCQRQLAAALISQRRLAAAVAAAADGVVNVAKLQRKREGARHKGGAALAGGGWAADARLDGAGGASEQAGLPTPH